MDSFSMIGTLLHTVVQFLAVALIIILVIRLFSPSRGGLGSRSPLTKLNRLTDPLVLPIQSALPPGTQPAVGVILAIFVILLVGFFFMSFVTDLLFGISHFVGGLIGGRPIAALGAVLYMIVSIFTTLVIVRIIFSWLRIGYYGAGVVTRFVFSTTEPIMSVFRGLIPSIGGLDLSPIILFILLGFVKSAVQQLLM